MAHRRRRGSFSVARASLPTLERHLAEARERVSSIEASLADCRSQAASAARLVKEIDQEFAEIEAAITRLRGIRQPKRGLMASVFRLTELPSDIKSQISALESRQSSLRNRQWELGRLPKSIGSWESSLERARSWLSKLEDAAARKRRKRDNLNELRARAASNVVETRSIGARVKRKLPVPERCPYCGDSLGPDPHADHIYPVSKGGRSVSRNMVYVCGQCNSNKKNLTLAAFILKFSLDRAAIEQRLQQLGKDF